MSIPEGIECVTLRDKKHPLYGSVLLYARDKCSLRSLEVAVTQAPTEANGQMAICTATATFAPPDSEARVFTEVGDASPRSCASGMHPHLVRLAATRAKGRALRDGCGITAALYEEMAEGETAEPVGNGASERPRPAAPPKPAGSAKGSGKFCQFEGCGVEVYPAELKESWDSFRRIFCKTHREEMRRRLATRPAA